jgi:hypothetical protein
MRREGGRGKESDCIDHCSRKTFSTSSLPSSFLYRLLVLSPLSSSLTCSDIFCGWSMCTSSTTQPGKRCSTSSMRDSSRCSFHPLSPLEAESSMMCSNLRREGEEQREKSRGWEGDRRRCIQVEGSRGNDFSHVIKSEDYATRTRT